MRFEYLLIFTLTFTQSVLSTNEEIHYKCEVREKPALLKKPKAKQYVMKITDGNNFYFISSKAYPIESTPEVLEFYYSTKLQFEFKSGTLSRPCGMIYNQHHQFVKSSVLPKPQAQD